MSDWEALPSEGEDMDELARAAAGVVGPHTLSPYPMYVPTGPPTAPTRVFPQANVQAPSEATQGDVKKKPRGDPERFKKMSLSLGSILVDYSKNIATEQTMKLLFGLADLQCER